ncbi:MAG: class I SAM-dependent methyltransferase [Desulfobacterales bacterium]
MRLNWIEDLLINNSIRPAVQHLLETRRLLRLGGEVSGAHVLEIGCGMGSGIQLIFSKFGAASVDAFELDPVGIRLARKRHVRRGRALRLWVGNVRHIPVADATYDAVFNFGVLHHVRRWREALAEIHRVLRPGGRFYCEEIQGSFITHPLVRRLLYHPQVDRFDRVEFAAALAQAGFQVLASDELFKLYLWFIADKPTGAQVPRQA